MQQLQDNVAVRRRAWGLHPNDAAELDTIDLSGWGEADVSLESAWFALAGGLLLAAEEGLPNPVVWATVAWHSVFGVGRGHGARRETVPRGGVGGGASLRSSGESTRGPGMDARTAGATGNRTGGTGRIEPAAGGVAARLPVEPGLAAARRMPRSRNAVATISGSTAERRTRITGHTFSTTLSSAVGTACGERRAGWRPTHLVTVASNSPSVVALAPAVLEVRKCLVLCDRRAGQLAVERCRREVRTFLEARYDVCGAPT